MLIRSILAALALLLLQTPARAEAPPIAAFFKKPAIRNPQLSPSGRYLAVLVPGKDDRSWLGVIDLQTRSSAKIVAGFGDADIWRHEWVNDERLVFMASNAPDAAARLRTPGLWAVNRDGSAYRQLIRGDRDFVSNETTRPFDRRLDFNWIFSGVPTDGSGEVLVKRLPWSNEGERASIQMARLDTKTGQLRNLSLGLPDHVYDWDMDWRGEPRAVTAEHAGRTQIYLREGDSWKPWQDFETYGANRHLEPFWFGPEGQTLVIGSDHGFRAVYRLDPKTLQPEAEPLIRFKGYDFNGSIVFDPEAKRLLGLHYETDAPGTVWLDPTMKAIQADIDAKLPGRVNRIDCERCLGAPNLVVTSLSDQLPAAYFLYQPTEKKIEVLANSRPGIRAADTGERDVHRIHVRDGLELPVLVTQPAGGLKAIKSGRAPTIVLVHGGPYVRGTHWAWEGTAQFLANRGYLVLEPEFRGSTGYGNAHFRAGWKQWGLAMQDDLADTLDWAVKQGWADPQRACIAGASYGGYAALMGAIKQGDRFRCAISWVGVTDIGLLSSLHWSDLSEEWKQYGMKRLVGDPLADAEQFKATSPVARAKEIRIPLLLAYGGDDRRVPLQHGTDFKAALRPEQDLEWVVYPDEGHGWFHLKTEEDFWGRVERFLAKHLAAPN
jgi:dipeptidyl aminopeptidase/acylaminoacyl peptidase